MENKYDYLKRVITVTINLKYSLVPPTITQLVAEANRMREILSVEVSISDEEYERLLKDLKSSMLVYIDDGIFIYNHDNGHKPWLAANRAFIDFYYWKRYKQYLEDNKGWSSGATAKLHKTTDEILDLLGNPLDKEGRFQVRGLVLGDVQSGKTTNYTAICNKAADCGYKVIIVLAGLTESLRIQTQERLDAEFAGRESKYLLDPKADQIVKNRTVGVGTIPPQYSNKRIACFTSVSTDFKEIILKSNDLTLRNISEAAIFVVKKNKSILNNLHKWLVGNNGDVNNKIDLPLLLIDDEADNASVNTREEEEDPTAINIAIRKILNSFYQASYLGITATPFANIFIKPDTEEDIPDDLFPKDFIYALSSPDNYIGADAIFGNSDDDHSRNQQNGKYNSSIETIYDSEMENFFKYGHKKALEVDSLPPSLYEALGYFLLINAIRDARGDVKEHRSMLVNVSRFVNVQSQIHDRIFEWLTDMLSDIRNYGKLGDAKVRKIPNLNYLISVWEKYKLKNVTDLSWQDLLENYLYNATSPIEVRAVNQKTGTTSLDYHAHKNDGLRVIAVGGNSLSRGLTLEGLCVSYFYRNSIMYDTLMQMGRWFGYRKNYDDLFKIWMSQDAVDWYGYISDAINELKLEIAKMRKCNQTPAEFGLKVRQDPNSLIATAKNKMRTATPVSRPITVSGRLLETPRLKYVKEILESNEKNFKNFAKQLDSLGVRREIKQNALFWEGVPKEAVIDLVSSFETHPWHLSFQSRALADYIEESDDLQKWDVAIPNGHDKEPYFLEATKGNLTIYPEERTVKIEGRMILISGTKVKVGSGRSTRMGLSDEKIKEIEQEFKDNYPDKTMPDSTYLIKGRNPILMLHIIKCKPEQGEVLPEKLPKYLFALGVGIPSNDSGNKFANYVVNINELKNWMDVGDYEEDDEDANN